MASSYKNIELPIPVRGMNSDVSPSQLAPGYSPYLRNVIVEPGQARVRSGWKRIQAYTSNYVSSTQTGHAVAGVAAYPSADGASVTLLTHLIDTATAYDSEYYRGFSLNTTAPSGNTKIRVTTIPETGAATDAAGGAAVGNYGQIIGNTVFYNGVVYGVYFDRGGAQSYPFYWAGGNNADFSTGGVTINNGSRTGTFGSAPSVSYKNHFLIVSGGATGPAANYRYFYRITDHTASSTSFTINEPYGLGESTANVPNALAASTTILVTPMRFHPGNISGVPIQGVGAVGLFRERLFLGRGSGPFSWAPNIMFWSKATYPQKIDNTNYAYLPTNEMIMGFATVTNAMLIFTQTKTFILTGYDESSFTLSLLSNEVGCIHSGSITYYQGRAYWASEQGIFASDGGYPVPVTHPAPGVGVRSDYLELAADVDGSRSRAATRYVGMGIVGDRLVASVNNTNTGAAQPDPFVLDLRTQAWARWGNTGGSAGYLQPWQYVQTSKRVFAVSPWQVTDITNCFEAETLPNPSNLLSDQDYTSAGATTTTTINAELQFADLRLGQDTVRVRGIQIEHNCHYFNATSSPRVAWAVTLDVDPDLDSGPLAVGNVDARYIGNVSTPAFQKYYTTRFDEDPVSVEGGTFRVKLTKTAQAHSAKVFRVLVAIDPQPVAFGRVDNPTL